MSENKVARIPIASHGLHKHTYNYPWLSSINFGDVMPCYINPIRKGEKDSPMAGMYSQLMPIAHNAFATGRFNFKAIFVPYKFVWKPWYAFDQQTTYYGSTGASFIPNRYPYVTHGDLAAAILSEYCSSATSNSYDLAYYYGTASTPPTQYFYLNEAGRRVLRILGALGCMPNFVYGDKHTINILPILCYLKAYLDYYFPNNYVGNMYYRDVMNLLETEDTNFNAQATNLLNALDLASLNYYENSVFDLAWDKPTTPNVGVPVPNISVTDVTNNADNNGSPSGAVVTNDPNSALSPNSSGYKPSNGTPFVGGQFGTSSIGNSYNTGVFTKFVLDALQSVSLWAKRHQLSGARLIDKFLVSRGVTLSNDSARISYFLGQRNVEISVSGVANTTDSALGELAGRGVASSGDEPLKFECKADDDGIFFVIVSPLPDANFPINLDGFANRSDYLDNYHSEYDKLGVDAVPARIVQQSLNGELNKDSLDTVFGFLNRYWDEVQERPRLLGDFILQSRGAEELSAYHTFRMFGQFTRLHSFDFVRMSDASQYQRLFYSSNQENLMLFLRWYGSQYKEKLPLGDSYDWDDDELNRKVSVVVGGSQN